MSDQSEENMEESSTDQFTETTTASWGDRIKGAFLGVLVGIALFVASFYLLTWNEGRSIDRATTLAEAKKIIVIGDPAKIDPQNEGKLLYLSGLLDASTPIKDTAFGITEKALQLQRIVQTYQWAESHETRTTKAANGGENQETTYSYDKVWREGLVPSRSFKHPTGHQNPSFSPYSSLSLFASPVFLGPYTIGQDLASQLHGLTPYPLTEETYQALEENMKAQFHLANSEYVTGDTQNPKIGDIRISYKVLMPQIICLLGKQTGNLIGTYAMKNGTVSLIETGVVGPEMLVRHAEMENGLMTWGLRLLGTGMMWFGLLLFLRPLVVIGSFVPFLGELLSVGSGLIATMIALPASLVTIALAWLAFRPLIGGGLLGLAALLFLSLPFIRAKTKAQPTITATVASK